MIDIGDNPEKKEGINKFIAPCGEGQRGKIIAIHKSKKEAVILAMNDSLKGDVQWGHFYHIREEKKDTYPVVIKEVYFVDNNKEWGIIK